MPDYTFAGITFNLGLIGWLIVGALAGLIAGNLQRGRGFGCIGNIIVGIVGAYIGGWLFSYLGVHETLGVCGSLIVSTIGAVILLFVADLLFPRNRRGPRRY
jgi:uncharacterized membrane protein YeaQ/YmgE (transglycosylase-associated protein family)